MWITLKRHGLTFAALAIFYTQAHAAEFTLESLDLKAGSVLTQEQVFDGFGCSGKNKSPDLKWSNAPADTKSYAVMVYDPDAPTGSGWWHWVVFNIPADVHKLDSGAGSTYPKRMPPGAVQSRTDFGKAGFGGACPPPGDKPHRYFFRVFALKDKLPLGPDTPAAQVGYYINQNKLAEAEILTTFGR